MLPAFFVIGVAFVPIGIGMYWFSQQVHEFEYNYTDCSDLKGIQCSQAINGTPILDRNCVCEKEFTLDEDWDGDVFLYYGLENFYQNHRRYVKSRDDNQLLGDLDSAPSTNCNPFLTDDTSNKTFVPCGAIANSLFSDVITLQYKDPSTQKWNPVPMIRTGIAWPSDKQYKFKNPALKGGQTLKDIFEKFAKPQDWKKNLWELDTENPDNNGLQNEDLIVWMRTAALPNFRKLYRKVDHGGDPFKKSLPAMSYKFVIEYS